MWFKAVFVACFVSVALCHEADLSILDERMPNGDESEIVSIDLKKKDGSEDIKVMAQLKFHMKENQIYVNGHPIVHGIVNSLRMRISIVEIEKGIKRAPRLAPVTFRVLVLEKQAANGKKQLIVEEEFVQVEEFEVLQFDVKQVIWEGSNRKHIVVTLDDSVIHGLAVEKDHRVLVVDPEFKPHLPSHPLVGGEDLVDDDDDEDDDDDDDDDDEKHRHHGKHGKHGNHSHHGHHGHGKHHGRHHHHHRHHSRFLCWFVRLPIVGKITVVCATVLTMFGLIASMIVCYKRQCSRTRNVHVIAPIDDFIEVDGCDDKKEMSKESSDDGHFHMEINECYVDVDDKKDLVN